MVPDSHHPPSKKKRQKQRAFVSRRAKLCRTRERSNDQSQEKLNVPLFRTAGFQPLLFVWTVCLVQVQLQIVKCVPLAVFWYEIFVERVGNISSAIMLYSTPSYRLRIIVLFPVLKVLLSG